MANGLQPFLIGEQKTGLFNYLEPWMRPIDAYEPITNAFVYRGSLQKRAGYSVFGHMAYQDTIANGNGGKTYSGTLQTHPIIAGSLFITDGVESFTDNGDGTLTGTDGGSGTIVYLTGAWTLSFNANVTSGVAILATYNPQITRAIMGIKTWSNEIDGSRKLVVMDTRRAAVYDNSSQSFLPLADVLQIIWVGDNATTTIDLSTGWIAVAPYTKGLAPFSISITDGTSTITDDGAGNLSNSGNFDVGGTVDYSTGVIHLVFVAATTATITLTATLFGDYFTGDTSNFFNSTNWMGLLYFVNNKDQITIYNGSTTPGTLSRQPFSIDEADYIAFVNNIGTCLDIDIYKNRFTVQRPTIVNAGAQNGIAAQSFRWSALFIPNNLVADVVGNGGELSAPTDDFIQSSEFLRDQIIVLFAYSTWTFRFTGSDFEPFRWDKLNSSKSTSAPYATIDYDERVTAMGSKGLIACDGVNVQRYDLQIIDQFLAINQAEFQQCFGVRFDSINQTWMLYPSSDNNASLSDSALIYNFLENTWSTYTIAMSCLGLYFVTQDKTWNDFAVNTPLGNQFPNWQSAEFAWNNFLVQGLAPILLGGGFDDTVYLLDTGETDNGTMIESTVTTTRWNPFSKIGQKVQFAYIDFYYEADPQNPNPAILQLSFYTSNSSAPATTRTLTLDASINSDAGMKRIFINNIGEFLRMEMFSNSTTGFKIFGLVLWAKPSGRWTP